MKQDIIDMKQQQSVQFFWQLARLPLTSASSGHPPLQAYRWLLVTPFLFKKKKRIKILDKNVGPLVEMNKLQEARAQTPTDGRNGQKVSPQKKTQMPHVFHITPPCSCLDASKCQK